MIQYKILTLWQPWATLLVHGEKKIETRQSKTNWVYQKGMYGAISGTYLIHAAQKFEFKNLCKEEPFSSALARCQDRIDTFSYLLPQGAIIGSVEVLECCPIINHFFTAKIDPQVKLPEGFESSLITDMDGGFIIRDKEQQFGNYSRGRFAWICQNPRILKIPIPYKGGQGYYQDFKGDESTNIFIIWVIHLNT